MKTWVNIGIWALLTSTPLLSRAQTATAPTETPFSITHREANERTWQRIVTEQLPSGQTISRVLSYEERGAGICHIGQNGQWMDSQEVISPLPDNSGLAATNGQSQAFFPLDIATGTVTLVTPAPESLVLESQPTSVSFSDGTNFVVIASLTNSTAELISSNEVLYPGALVGPGGLKCDVLYEYRKGGLEQDIVFRNQPPDPAGLGLSVANVKVQVATLFLSPPAPAEAAEPLDPQSGLADTTLTFGGTKMIQGRAFLTGDASQGSQIPTFKTWVPINSTSAALIEQLPYSQISASLATLPAVASAKLPLPHGHGLFAANYPLPYGRGSVALAAVRAREALRKLAPARMSRSGTNVVRVSSGRIGRGFCLDYIAINGYETNVVFRGDSTFYVSSPCYLYGLTVLEGGTTIKENSSGQINIESGGTVDCQTSPYFPALFTSFNDNAVGDSFGSGSPAMGDVNTFLNFNSTNVTLHDLHFAYALTDVNQTSAGSTASIALWDSEFVDVATAVNAYNIGLYNVLIGRTVLTNAAVIVDGTGSLVAENVTADYGNEFIQATNSGATIALTNCLVTRQPLVATGSSVTLQTNAVVCLPTLSAPVYQICGGGNYYLTNGSPYATAGTPNIAPDLLADLQQKTVWPPIVYADTNISSLGTLSPAVARDTNSFPPIGFSYDPLDYVFGGADLYSNLTVTAGTAIGWFEEVGGVNVSGQPYSMTLNNGANLTFNGNATQPCYWSQYAMVQERGNNNWNDYSGYKGSFTFNGSTSSQEPLLYANFTKFTVGDTRIILCDNGDLGAGSFKNCEIYNACLGTFDMQYLTFTNCLFFRPSFTFWDSEAALNFTNENCTYYNGEVALNRSSGQNASFWLIENTIFDGTLVVYLDNCNGNTNYTLFNYNAYNTNNLSWQTYGFPYSNWTQTNIWESSGPNGVMVTNYNWESSLFGLGDFYLPTNSPLIRAGSTNANFLGLYHFTTQTNQVPDGTNIVTIGYHYVATDTNGNPLDSNGDGIPDYLEDANGDGLVDDGETNWALAILTQPVSQIAVPGTNADFYVGADGVEPLSYQWYFNGTNMAGATNSTLTLTNVQSADVGLYFAVVSNFSGSLTSSVAALEPSGLIGWWPGESNALDNAGPNDGNLNDGMSFTNGIVGQAFQFDGTNGFILVPDNPILKPTNLTIEVWVRFSSLKSQEYGWYPATNLQIIAEKPDINPTSSSYFNDAFYNDGYVLFKQKNKNHDNFEFGVAASDGETEVYATNSTLSIQANVWYFVAGVRGSNYIQLYVNGQLSDQESVDFDQSYGTAPLYFGSSGEPIYLDGRLKGVWMRFPFTIAPCLPMRFRKPTTPNCRGSAIVLCRRSS